jgi:hypothetical protein
VLHDSHESHLFWAPGPDARTPALDGQWFGSFLRSCDSRIQILGIGIGER